MSLSSDLQKFIHTLTFLRPSTPVLVACSGGPDSVALVHLLKSLESQLPFQFHVAHINHGLRGRSSIEDAQFVRRLAHQLGWPFHQKSIRVRGRRGNLEENARVGRYSALDRIARDVGASVIMTAHTLDDQVETVLMNLIRGSGLDGLSGIHPVRNIPPNRAMIIRPLLHASKKNLLRYLRQKHYPFRRDESNFKIQFFRNWLRGKVIPLIEVRSPGFKERIMRTAALIQSDHDYWQQVTAEVRRRVIKIEGNRTLLDLRSLLRYPPAVQRRLLRSLVGEDLLTFDGLERWRHWMMASPTSGRMWQLRKGWIIERLSRSKGSPSAHLFWIRRERPRAP